MRNGDWRSGLATACRGRIRRPASGGVRNGVLPPDHNFERDLAMSEYALVSRPLLKRRFGVDAVLARRDSPLYHTYVEFFSRVREAPQLRKGLLRLRLSPAKKPSSTKR